LLIHYFTFIGSDEESGVFSSGPLMFKVKSIENFKSPKIFTIVTFYGALGISGYMKRCDFTAKGKSVPFCMKIGWGSDL